MYFYIEFNYLIYREVVMDLNILGKSNKELAYLLDELEGEQLDTSVFYGE